MSRLAVPLRDPVRPPQNRAAGNFATSTSGSAYGVAALLTSLIAFAVRLLTVLRGGGLHGTVGYDGPRSGSVTVVARFRKGRGSSKVTKRLIGGWPVLGRSGTHELQQPGLA